MLIRPSVTLPASTTHSVCYIELIIVGFFFSSKIYITWWMNGCIHHTQHNSWEWLREKFSDLFVNRQSSTTDVVIQLGSFSI